jgi:hypothetical protein
MKYGWLTHSQSSLAKVREGCPDTGWVHAGSPCGDPPEWRVVTSRSWEALRACLPTLAGFITVYEGDEPTIDLVEWWPGAVELVK